MTTRGVTIVVHADGDLESKQYRFPRWAVMAGKWGAGAIAVLVVLFFAFAGPITRNAVLVPGLKREVSRLRVENSRVQQLASALNRAEANYQELRQMLGVKAPPVSRSGGTVARTTDLTTAMRAGPIRAALPGATKRYETGPSTPSHWPLDVAGFVTRGQVRPGVVDESHPGIDIAVPLGTPVRASGGGSVAAAGYDADYGLFVLLRHPSGYVTMYGHMSRLVAAEGDEVQAGQVIGLSGNSGRSTAPHLHFEIRRDEKAVDPLDLVKEGR
ncbi:MAG TPA: M23 family metallopeptidase [Gemmatimonadales bacterium]|jgi:murein DD-endopeptidase MepM/ murein hydrolase activator NlpD|nr:M23 family metallopeptidase [Gemmatimonadales bacterium]